MKEQEFLCLHSPESTARLAEWVHEEMDLEQVTCSITRGHERGGKRLHDLSVALPNRPMQDIVWTWQSECLIQDRVLDLFKDKGFSGFEVKPAKAVFKKSAERPPRLWELIVTGWAGMAPEESGVRLIEKCPACGFMVYSGCTDPTKLIAPDQWDGSDFFMVWPMSAFVFVTKRVAQTIREERVKGAVLRSPSELTNLTDGFGPGRLSHWMPEKRARELGEPLDIY